MRKLSEIEKLIRKLLMSDVRELWEAVRELNKKFKALEEKLKEKEGAGEAGRLGEEMRKMQYLDILHETNIVRQLDIVIVKIQSLEQRLNNLMKELDNLKVELGNLKFEVERLKKERGD